MSIYNILIVGSSGSCSLGSSESCGLIWFEISKLTTVLVTHLLLFLIFCFCICF